MNNLIARYIFALGVLVCMVNAVQAQPYGNEWINPDQQYLKIPVAEDGIYKVTYEELLAAGWPVGSINPKTIQLFHRGTEQAIQVEGEINAVFEPGESILFFGQKNDGTLDTQLYKTPEAQPHTYYNLYSDTTAYFLTYTLDNSGGKRMGSFSANNTDNLPAESYVWKEQLKVFTDNYHVGLAYPFAGSYKTYSAYGDFGEGFTGTVIANGNSRTIAFTGLGEVVSGSEPTLEVILSGRNNLERSIEILGGNAENNLSSLGTASFSGGNYYSANYTLPLSMLEGGNFYLKIQTQSGERVSVASAKLRYPGAPGLDGAAQQQFSLSAGEAQKYISFTDVPEGSILFDVSQAEAPVKIGLQNNNGALSAIVPNTQTERELLLTTQLKPVARLEWINFRTLPANADYLMVTHPILRQAAEGYQDPVQAYAEYRSSAVGGGHTPLLLNVDEVFNYFSYGETTSLGIRNLARYYGEQADAKHLFLIGKALTTNYNYYRQTNWTGNDSNLVPTYGYPGADLPFVTQIKGSGELPAMGVGRLTAQSAAAVAHYLNKIKETEAQSSEQLAFRKELVHLSGGTTRSEANAMRNYLLGYERVAEGLYAGANVTTYSKTEEVIVQEINISEIVNDGVGLITFFGHSGADITDIEIGYVTEDRNGYQNKGLYPCILVNGCSAGQIFSNRNNLTFGEDWMLAADRGALNFIAHSGTGYTNFLRTYSANFYQQAFTDSTRLTVTVGDIISGTVAGFLNSSGNSDLVIAQAHQVVLQGDPANQLFGFPKPDYKVEQESFALRAQEGNPVTLSADSLAVKVAISNLGSARPDSVLLNLSASLEGAETVRLWEGYLPPVYYKDSLEIWFKTSDLLGAGLTEFTLHYNVEQKPDELNFLNNQASFVFNIRQGGAIPLLPAQFAMEPKDDPLMYIQLASLLGGERQVMVELDTTASFSSPAKVSATLAVNGLAQWEPGLDLSSDSLTYFWRTKLLNPSPEEDTSWVTSSFSHISNGEYGWTQRKTAQFQKNVLSSLVLENDGIFRFPEIRRSVKIEAYGADYAGNGFTQLLVDGISYVNEAVDSRAVCSDNSMNAIQLKGETLEIVLGQPYGLQFRQTCGTLPQIVNNFTASDLLNGNNDDYNLEGYLEGVEQGNWVYLFTIGLNEYSRWPQSLWDQFANFGLDPASLQNLIDGEPLVIRMRKGGTAEEVRLFRVPSGSGAPSQQLILANDELESNVAEGTMLSGLIGPAQGWGSLNFSAKAQLADVSQLFVIAVDEAKNESLYQTLNGDTKLLDLSQLDAQRYPFIKLVWYTRDTEQRTPAQLNYWQVTYDALPEGVLLPSDTLTLPLERYAGDMLEGGFRYINLSRQAYATDSLLVQQQWVNQNNRQTYQQAFNIVAPQPGDTTAFPVQLEAAELPGRYALSLGANVDLSNERLITNNSLSVGHFADVVGDSLQPSLDVIFDGTYISNGSIVSPDPLIQVSVRDNKAYFQKNDSTSMQMELRRHCEGCEFEEVDLKGNKVSLAPGNGDDEPFKVDYRPGPLEDGMYTLKIQATDDSGNKAGEEPYSIDFEVINESTITHIYPYPNPFSTSTRFVFTLTGSKVPDNMKIQIMNQSGRVVREIFKEELGPIKIGHNISQYGWNGRDEWGDQLANGVYFYRVIISDAEQSFDHRSGPADKAFKKGLGKIYLLR